MSNEKYSTVYCAPTISATTAQTSAIDGCSSETSYHGSCDSSDADDQSNIPPPPKRARFDPKAPTTSTPTRQSTDPKMSPVLEETASIPELETPPTISATTAQTAQTPAIDDSWYETSSCSSYDGYDADDEFRRRPKRAKAPSLEPPTPAATTEEIAPLPKPATTQTPETTTQTNKITNYFKKINKNEYLNKKNERKKEKKKEKSLNLLLRVGETTP